jgi:YD repeat-containing protein
MEESDFYHNLFLPPSIDYGGLRGRIQSVSDYMEDNVLRRKVEYQYQTVLTAVCPTFINSISRFYRVPFRGIRVCQISEEIREYEDEVPKLKTVSTGYNALAQKEFESNSDVTTHSGYATYTRYSHETDTSALKTCPSMVVHTVIRGTQQYVTSLERYTYDSQWRHASPVKVQVTQWNVPQPLPQDPFSISPYYGETSTVFLTYDNRFRLVRAVGPGGRTFSYTWDNAGRHIIQKSGSLPVDITLFNWKDLVGLTQETAPTGQVTQWEYDGKRRLKYKKNSLGQKEVEYQYHLNHE